MTEHMILGSQHADQQWMLSPSDTGPMLALHIITTSPASSFLIDLDFRELTHVALVDALLDRRQASLRFQNLEHQPGLQSVIRNYSFG